MEPDPLSQEESYSSDTPVFDCEYQKHEFSELIRLSLAITDTLVRVLKGHNPFTSAAPPRLDDAAGMTRLAVKANVETLPTRCAAKDGSADDPGLNSPRPSDASEKAPSAQRRSRASILASSVLFAAALFAAGESAAGEADIPVVLHAVSCAADLLACRDVEPEQSAFADMSACSREIKRMQARLKPRQGRVIFMRCRYSPVPARNAPVLREVARQQPFRHFDLPATAYDFEGLSWSPASR